MWLKSQLPLWEPLVPLAWLGPALFSRWCPLPFCVGNASFPWASLQPTPPRPHFPELSTVWTPSHPGRAQPGAGPEFLSSPIPPSSPHRLPYLRGARIHPAAQSTTLGDKTKSKPLLFHMGHCGPEMGARFSGS